MAYFYLYHGRGVNYDVYALYEDREDAEALLGDSPDSEVISLPLMPRTST